MTTPTPDARPNPFVGPRTFTTADRTRYFGREQEAASLLGRVVSERLLLFYAQSGAGKSSLINARLIPALRGEEGFSVLPVGRVAGVLPADVAQVENIFLFNLMASLDQAGENPGQFAHSGLSDFLEHLVTEDGVAWRFDPDAAAEADGETPGPEEEAAPAPRFALVIDQFEEIITGHPDRWREREGFFRQLDATLQANPNLWIVLSLREDYVAALDPYAPLVFNRLRARFYMERMGVAAGLEAIRKPAELAGRPFAEGVAEKLADDLRQVRVPGQEATVPGQYVEPVQLQVVCYQLWQGLGETDEGRGTKDEGRLITFDDLAQAGDVDRALTQFYEETLAAALADPAAGGASERQVRDWFDKELITETGTRGLVHQGESETSGLPNGVVLALQRRFLVRSEARGGDTWIELVHDRLVEPVLTTNRAWHSRTQRQTELQTNLTELGWGVIFASDAVPDVHDALAPLLHLRRAQATARQDYYKEFSGAKGYFQGDTARSFLVRQGADAVERASPDRMPYYLLIVGDPETIPFEFQYELDGQYAVGRIHFETIEEYASYARSVVAAENGAVTLPNRVTFFATQHHSDMVRACKWLAAKMEETHPDWLIETVLQTKATKARLAGLLESENHSALLVTASWGARFPCGHYLQVNHQGSPVTSDWRVTNRLPLEVPRDNYFSAEDVTVDAQLSGTMALMLGSYTAGTPNDRGASVDPMIESLTSAPRAFLAHLPQRLLGHSNGGVLAVIGHVDVLYSTSFEATSEYPGLSALETTIRRLLSGSTVGAAAQALNDRYKTLSLALVEPLLQHIFGSNERKLSQDIERLRAAAIDARNYIVIGDPAVRLPVAQLEKP
jgi:hypothetical protein